MENKNKNNGFKQNMLVIIMIWLLFIFFLNLFKIRDNLVVDYLDGLSHGVSAGLLLATFCFLLSKEE